jgi:hypothetical protein
VSSTNNNIVYPIYPNSVSLLQTEQDTLRVVPIACTTSSIWAAQTGSKNLTNMQVSLRKNATSVLASCTLNSSTPVCSDTGNTPLVAGDLISVELSGVESLSSKSTGLAITVTCQ